MKNSFEIRSAVCECGGVGESPSEIEQNRSPKVKICWNRGPKKFRARARARAYIWRIFLRQWTSRALNLNRFAWNFTKVNEFWIKIVSLWNFFKSFQKYFKTQKSSSKFGLRHCYSGITTVPYIIMWKIGRGKKMSKNRFF